MLKKLRNGMIWLPEYIKQHSRLSFRRPKHLFFSICDHFEPYYSDCRDAAIAGRRIKKWADDYPGIAERYRDSQGKWLKYSFFYPENEYREYDMNVLAELCGSGYGEVEIHLHHDNDTSENLRRTLLDFKHTLYEKHGLLSRDRVTGDISYGFIHGNWALDNSRRDGCLCGVNDEITILKETGCYADFTMPSAPSETQTRKINSLYYALDDPHRPKSHDTGVNVSVGKKGEGLLMVQGPLGLNWSRRKFGILPTLEYGGLYAGHQMSKERILCWLNERVTVEGADEAIFIKLYNHGAFDEMLDFFFDRGGLSLLLSNLTEICEEEDLLLHFVSAREMVNVILGLESGSSLQEDLTGFRYITNHS
jgi:hypothetical protein